MPASLHQELRDQLIASLQHEWGTLAGRFHRLPPPAQEAWLAQQGYARLADVLAHVIAWWEEAMPRIIRLAAGEEVEHKQYDEARFNAEAVARFAAQDEAQVIAAFEADRQQWLALLRDLPDAALADPHIADRLRIELIGHYQEHTLANAERELMRLRLQGASAAAAARAADLSDAEIDRLIAEARSGFAQ